mgnify:CR=1 FL=1
MIFFMQKKCFKSIIFSIFAEKKKVNGSKEYSHIEV